MTQYRWRLRRTRPGFNETTGGVAVLTMVLAAMVAAQSPDRAPTGPRLRVTEPVVELGTVQAGDIVPMMWRLENVGDADLVIQRIKPGCGCTIVHFSEKDQIIPAGGALDLEGVFDSTGRRGDHDKEVLLYTNDPVQAEFRLSFRALVDRLYEVVPSRMVDLRTVQRGTSASRTIDVVEDPDRSAVTVLEVEVPDGTPLDFSIQPFQESKTQGKRITVGVRSSAPTGKLKTDAILHLKLGDQVRQHKLTLRAEIVGEITWLPRVVDATRRMLRPGNSLAPVTLRAAAGNGFRVLRATCDPIFDVHVDPAPGSSMAKRHLVKLTVRDDAEPGPFGLTLRIETDAPDKPVINVPVYGIVTPPLQIEPPIVVLHRDGTTKGETRQLRLQTYPGTALSVSGFESKLPGLVVHELVDRQNSQRHIRFVEVRATEALAPGAHESMIVLSTNVPGFDHVEIPVRVKVAK